MSGGGAVRMWALVVSLLAGAIVLGAPALGGPAPSARPITTAAPGAKKRCRIVVKKVKGKKKRVRVCTKKKPKPKPPPPPPPPPSTVEHIDVGGYRLAIECMGEGGPTVVLDAEHGGSRFHDWRRIQPDVAKTTRVCSYDRAGLGESEARPGQQATTAKVVEELHTLLERAGLTGPFVLAGNSMGGLDVRYFALRFPAEAAGIVTVDGTTEGAMKEAHVTEFSSPLETIVFGSALDELLSPAGDLGARPLAVLVHGIRPTDAPPGFEEVWQRTQRDVARRSTSSVLARADRSDHDIWQDQPALVVEAIRQVVAAVRNGAALPACAQTPLPQLDATCLDPNAS